MSVLRTKTNCIFYHLSTQSHSLIGCISGNVSALVHTTCQTLARHNQGISLGLTLDSIQSGDHCCIIRTTRYLSHLSTALAFVGLISLHSRPAPVLYLAAGRQTLATDGIFLNTDPACQSTRHSGAINLRCSEVHKELFPRSPCAFKLDALLVLTLPALSLRTFCRSHRRICNRDLSFRGFSRASLYDYPKLGFQLFHQGYQSFQCLVCGLRTGTEGGIRVGVLPLSSNNHLGAIRQVARQWIYKNVQNGREGAARQPINGIPRSW